MSDQIFEMYPNLTLGVIVCTGINNQPSEVGEKILADSVILSKEKIGETALMDFEVVKNWREAYKQFGEKKNRSSIEALLRRVANDKPLPSINPLVDIYNAISIKHFLPCGGEDIDSLVGDLQLTLGTGVEPFRPLGEAEDEFPPAGEVIYKDDEKIICRSFNWRESDLSKLTNDTEKAVLVVECIAEEDRRRLIGAVDELNSLVQRYCQASTEIYIVNTDERNFEI